MPGNGPVFQRGKRSTLSRCRICGRKLSSYNNTGQCWCHSVEDPEQNARWEPGHNGIGYGDGYKVGFAVDKRG